MADWGDKDTQLKGEEYIEQNYGNALSSFEEENFLFIIGDLLDVIEKNETKIKLLEAGVKVSV